MAITAKTGRGGGTRYLTYIYKDGDRMVGIYCGKEGEARTESKIREARRRHYEARMARLQARLLG